MQNDTERRVPPNPTGRLIRIPRWVLVGFLLIVVAVVALWPRYVRYRTYRESPLHRAAFLGDAAQVAALIHAGGPEPSPRLGGPDAAARRRDGGSRRSGPRPARQ